MPYLQYPPPRDDICKYGNRHPNGFLCGQCRADANKQEAVRLEKAEKARKFQELLDSIFRNDGGNHAL